MKIYYKNMTTMQPRPGVKYATTYVKQTAKQRSQLTDHLVRCTRLINTWINTEQGWSTAMDRPLKGFPTTQGQNRTPMTVIVDILNEAQGRQRNGQLKDYALAPIERWNKLFQGTEFAFELESSEEYDPWAGHEEISNEQNVSY